MDLSPTSRLHLLVWYTLATGVLLGCQPEPNRRLTRSAPPEGYLITQADIARSGATNAWEAIRRNGSYLLIRENSRGDATRITQRGPTSLLLSSEVYIVVDGVRLADAMYLKEIPAETISKIQIFSGVSGTTRYGTGAGNGVVLVSTGTL